VDLIVGEICHKPDLTAYFLSIRAEGEFTLLKSTITQREVQGRFAFFADIFSPGW
jgi:hypothetical protein